MESFDDSVGLTCTVTFECSMFGFVLLNYYFFVQEFIFCTIEEYNS
jgi:hypothetical protein